jgi:hypothetical protein
MAKSDHQNVLVTPAGQMYRDDGKLGLSLALNNLLTANGPLDAAASGIPVGGLYVEATTSGVAIRLS